MASGLSGRANSGSKGFDFGSDDILCPYEDYNGNQDSSNGGQSSDPAVGINSSKDFHKSRMTRSSVFPTPYRQPEDSFNQDLSSIVEKSMKKYADNLMRFLEGISSRLSQLELYCYNLDKSIGEMRSDLARDHDGADLKLKFLEKHLREVHRSVQILRDKQELAETQKELSKLQLVQKESSSPSQSQFNEDKSSTPASDAKKSENSPEMHNQQLALALPHQVAPQQQQQQPAVLPSQPAPQNVIQQQPYYLTSNQLPTPAPQTQHSQSQYSDPQYRTPPMQEMSRVPQPAQTQVNQTPPVQSFPQYQQQWPQQVPQQVPPPQQPSIQPQVGPQSSTVYHPYPTGQSTNASPETLPSSMSMQVPFSSVPQPVSSRADAMPYGYTGAGRTGPQQPTQQGKVTFGAQTGDGYAVAGAHQGLPPGSAYMMYDSERARPHHQPQQPHFPQGGYPPMNLSLQNPQPSAATMARNPNHSQFVRNHPYNELIEKLVSMGCRGDHVVSVIQRMEESGQPVDFNSVLDRLNVQGSQSQRGW